MSPYHFEAIACLELVAFGLQRISLAERSRSSFVLFVICAFTYYYLIPRMLTALIRRKILDNAVNELSEALSKHVVPLAIRIVVVPVGVTVLLGLRNPPRSWTGTTGPSLPGFTIAPCVDSLLCYRLIRRHKSILQYSP
jgi:hypothetical protein